MPPKRPETKSTTSELSISLRSKYQRSNQVRRRRAATRKNHSSGANFSNRTTLTVGCNSSPSLTANKTTHTQLLVNSPPPPTPVRLPARHRRACSRPDPVHLSPPLSRQLRRRGIQRTRNPAGRRVAAAALRSFGYPAASAPGHTVRQLTLLHVCCKLNDDDHGNRARRAPNAACSACGRLAYMQWASSYNVY